MDVGSFLIGMVITAFAYLFVPTILAIRGKPLKVKKVAIINLVVVYTILTIIIIEAGGSGGLGESAGGLLWAWLGYYILKKKCSPIETYDIRDNTVVKNEKNVEDSIHTQETTVEVKHIQEAEINTTNYKKIKFCSKCGAIIDSETKKCIGCGKQYFKGIGKRFAWILVIILFIGLIMESVVLLNTYGELVTYKENYFSKNNTVREQEERISDLQNEIYDLQAKWNVIDENVVFIEDDGTNLYHKYECDKFVGNSCWIFNIEYAIDRGYRECPECH